MAEKTKPARDYLNEKVPIVIEKVIACVAAGLVLPAYTNLPVSACLYVFLSAYLCVCVCVSACLSICICFLVSIFCLSVC